MEAEINYNISSPEVASNFLGSVVSTASVVKAAGCTVWRECSQYNEFKSFLENVLAAMTFDLS
jgi:hypothetical protein